MNLQLDIFGSVENGEPHRHPQKIMEELGITYECAVPQSLADSWWFLNVGNVPPELPTYIRELELSDEQLSHWMPYATIGSSPEPITDELRAELCAAIVSLFSR